MSTKQNDSIIELLQQELIEAMESGNREKEIETREKLLNSGLLSQEEVNELEMYI